MPELVETDSLGEAWLDVFARDPHAKSAHVYEPELETMTRLTAISRDATVAR